MRRFDPPSLYAAVDAARQERGLTWDQVGAATGVAASTVKRMRGHGRFEIDGVLAVVQWLGRPLEDFTRPGTVPPEVLRRAAGHGPQEGPGIAD